MKEIEEQILLDHELKFDKVHKIQDRTVRGFLINFLTVYNHRCNTVYVESGLKQTPPGRRRSLSDIYRIVKHYFPDTELKEVIRLLYIDFPKNLPHFRSSRCFTISKRVFYVSRTLSNAIHDKETIDEYGYTWNNWLDMLENKKIEKTRIQKKFTYENAFRRGETLMNIIRMYNP